MNYTQKKYTALSLILLCAFFVIHLLVKNYVVKQINNIAKNENVDLHFDDISINILTASASAKNLSLKTNIATGNNFHFHLSRIDINNLSYYKILFKKEFLIQSIQLESPKLKLFKQIGGQNKSNQKQKKPITINSIVINGGTFELYKPQQDSSDFSIKKINLKINKASLSSADDKSPLSFSYKNIESELYALSLNVGKWEKLLIDKISIHNKNILFSNFKLETILGRKTLSKYLKNERDHIALRIPEIGIQKWFHKQQDSTHLIGAEVIKVKNADLNLYRDKAVPDNTTYKSLYAEKIRNLNFGIDFPIISIQDASINYEQLLEGNKKPGKLHFQDLKATVSVSNLTNKDHQLTIDANSKFMGSTDITLNTSFQSFKSDEFTAKGVIKNFDGNSINNYLEKNLRTRIKGRADEIYFTITGNNTKAIGDIKMKYNDLEIEILKKDVLQVNKFLTTIGNLLLPKKENINEYHYGKIETKRDQTKSFFNFLWLSLRDGLKNVLTSRDTSKK